MSTLTIRGCDEKLSRALHSESEKRGISINKLVLEQLETAFAGGRGKRYHADLDHLAGTWTKEDAEQFDEATVELRKINPEDWK